MKNAAIIAGLLALGGGVALAMNRGKATIPVAFLDPVLGPISEALEPILGPDAFGRRLTWQEVNAIVTSTVNAHFSGRVDPGMALTIASIESDFDPRAMRIEAHIGDASIGLMQTLTRTAQWLARDMGYTAKGVPSSIDLFDPEISAYFGIAYLDYLAHRHPSTREQGEEIIVRAYNGGPGGARKDYTASYWAKYQARKRELFGA